MDSGRKSRIEKKSRRVGTAGCVLVFWNGAIVMEGRENLGVIWCVFQGLVRIVNEMVGRQFPSLL